MSTATDQPSLTAADVAAMLRAVVEASEVLTPIDDPGDHRPEFQFEPGEYEQFVLYRAAYPSQAPPGTIPFQLEFHTLVADVRKVFQRQGINAGACKAFVPATPPGDHEARLYFKLGAFIFLAIATPEEGLRWRLGLSINVDPDAIEDDE